MSDSVSKTSAELATPVFSECQRSSRVNEQIGVALRRERLLAESSTSSQEEDIDNEADQSRTRRNSSSPSLSSASENEDEEEEHDERAEDSGDAEEHDEAEAEERMDRIGKLTRTFTRLRNGGQLVLADKRPRASAASSSTESGSVDWGEDDEPHSDWRNIYKMSAFAFVDAFQFSFFVWSFWPFVQQLDSNISPTFIGVIMAVSGLGEAGFAPLFGYWTNRCGRVTPPLYASLALSALGNAGYATLNAWPREWIASALLATRLLAGSGSGNRGTMLAYIAASTLSADRTRGMALCGGGALIGITAGPAVQMAFTWIGANGLHLPAGIRISMYTAPALLALGINIGCVAFLWTSFAGRDADLDRSEPIAEQQKPNVDSSDNDVRSNASTTFDLLSDGDDFNNAEYRRWRVLGRHARALDTRTTSTFVVDESSSDLDQQQQRTLVRMSADGRPLPLPLRWPHTEPRNDSDLESERKPAELRAPYCRQRSVSSAYILQNSTSSGSESDAEEVKQVERKAAVARKRHPSSGKAEIHRNFSRPIICRESSAEETATDVEAASGTAICRGRASGAAAIATTSPTAPSGRPQFDKVAVVVCMLTRSARMFVTANVESVGAPYSEVMFDMDEAMVLDYGSLAQAALGAFTMLMLVVYAATNYTKIVSERSNCIGAMFALLAFHLLTFPWPFLATGGDNGAAVNCSRLGGDAVPEWCDDLRPVNVYLYYAGYILVFGIALPCLNNSLQSLYSLVLGDAKRQGTMQGLNQAVGSISRVLGPLVMSSTFTRFGPRATWAIEIATLVVFLGVWALCYRRLVPAHANSPTDSSKAVFRDGKPENRPPLPAISGRVSA